jgi:hypothetical protein
LAGSDPKIGRSLYQAFAFFQHFLKGVLLGFSHTVFVWSCRMRKVWPAGIASFAGELSFSRPTAWARAGLTGIAYRLAHLAVSRPTAIAFCAGVFYLT